jgi:hypothetical protein
MMRGLKLPSGVRERNANEPNVEGRTPMMRGLKQNYRGIQYLPLLPLPPW